MHSRPLYAVTLALAAFHCQAAQLVTKETLPSVSLSPGCVDALVAEVSCPRQIVGFGSGSQIATALLEESCTTSCGEALRKYEASVSAACTKNDVYSVSQTRTASVSLIPTLIHYHFNKTCIRDAGRWCHKVVYGMSRGNEQTTTAENATSLPDMCDDCVIKGMQFQAGSPIDGGPRLRSNYSSLTSSCSKTNFPLVTSAVPFSRPNRTSTAIPTPSCRGNKYAIRPGDTCRSISKSQSVGTAWLLQDNGLAAFCSDFPTNGHLCITHGCRTYTVRANDTCKSVARSHYLSQTQLYTWNPILGNNCRAFNRSVGDEICISPPGNKAWSPPTAPTSTNSTATAVPVPSTIANGTNAKCARYYTVEKGDYCNKVILKFSISLGSFLFLNAGVNLNCTNLFAGESYCVAPVGSIDDYPGSPGYVSPESSVSDSPYRGLRKATFTAPKITSLPTVLPIAKGTREDCYAYADGSELNMEVIYNTYKSVCEALANAWGMGLEQLQNWNPSLNTSSHNCAPKNEYRYCMIASKDAWTAPTPSASSTGGNSTLTSSPSATPTSAQLRIRAELSMACASVLEKKPTYLLPNATNPSDGIPK